MDELINEFIIQLNNKKNISQNTINSYSIDIKKLLVYMEVKSKKDIKTISKEKLKEYIDKLSAEKKCATVSRNIASIKDFFVFALENGYIDINPSLRLKYPKAKEVKPEILSMDEVDKLLNQLKGKAPKELRDKAMLELMYATGLKVSELIELKLEDVHLADSYVVCRNKKGERQILFGDVAKNSIDEYLKNGRDGITSAENNIMFPNVNGNKMTRQGFWKVVKSYGKKAGIEKDISPGIIRNSFAAHMINSGANLEEVTKLMGYTTNTAAYKYLSSKNNRLKK